MKQEILCMKCAEEAKGFIKKYPGEDYKFKKGDASGDYWCDHCGGEILEGKECVALSLWATRGGVLSYYPWEGNYLKNMQAYGGA